jgi:hypothetical protein
MRDIWWLAQKYAQRALHTVTDFYYGFEFTR